MADLNDIYDRLGQLSATTQHIAEEQRRATCRGEKLAAKLDEVHDEVKATTASQTDLKTQVDGMKPHVEDYKNLKQKALTIWSMVTLAAGFGGALAFDFVKGFWK